MAPVRAILALAVLFGHFQFYSVPALLPLRHLAAPSVAMFLFISGFGLDYSFQQKGDNYLHFFFKRRVVKIALPAILVTLLHIWLFGNGGADIIERARLIATKGNTLLPHYWYGWTILLFYLLFWSCYRFLHGWATRFAVLVGVVCFTAATRWAGFDRCWWICSLAFPTGIYFAQYKSALFSFCEKRELFYWLLLLLLGVAFVGLFLTRIETCWAFCYVLITIIGALIVSRLPLDRLKIPVLRFLGSISYEIYLVHITVMCLLRGGFLYIESNPLFVMLVICLTIVLAYGIHLLCKTITQITNL